MRKILLYNIIIICSLIFWVPQIQAFETDLIQNHQAGYLQISPGTFDNLVFDFSLQVNQPDVLKAIGLQNIGSSDYINQIKYLKLWQDKGAPGFQGFGVDHGLDVFSYSINHDSWYIGDLDLGVYDQERFFVTVETFSAILKAGTIQLQIPSLIDQYQNNIFEPGDLGMFLGSGDNGPVNQAITNSAQQFFSTKNQDLIGPTLVLGNFQDLQVINQDSFVFNGFARDQGNNGVSDLNLVINALAYPVIDYNQQTYEFNYQWQGIADGDYDVYLRAQDDQGNFSQTDPIKFVVKKQLLSLSNSSVELSKDTISSNGIDGTNVLVTLKDSLSQPVLGWKIDSFTDPELLIVNHSGVSNEAGQIRFEIHSTDIGIKKVPIKINGQQLAELEVSVVDMDLSSQTISFGDLIKGTTKGVYYYAANGKRYVFPNQEIYYSWYADFSTVEKISDQQLGEIPLGGNITFKPGTQLVKIQSDPKVYAIDAYGVLHWILNPQAAQDLYGVTWTSKIIDVADVFFVNYQIGETIDSAAAFNPQAVIETIQTINLNKKLI